MWRVECFKIGKRDFMFIREMRVCALQYFQTFLKFYFPRLKSEVSETEERKNAQIEQMKRKHEKAFNDIKNYYNDITLNNLAMIR